MQVADFNLAFEGVRPVRGANWLAERARLLARGPDGAAVLLHPERRIYPIRGIATSEAAIDYSLRGDLYAVLGDNWPDEGRPGEGPRIFRLYWNPLVSLIWLGAGLMALGGLCALAARRRPAAARP